MEFVESLDARKKRALLAGTTVVCIAVLYFFAWSPLSDRTENLRRSVPEQRELLAWMETAAVEIRQLRSADAPGAQSSNGSLIASTSAATGEAGLEAYLRQIQPSGERQLTVWIDGAPFDTLLSWMEMLWVEYGIAVSEVAVARSANPGLVEARIVLKR